MIKRCLTRMRCWVIQADGIVNAEFPSWELLQAFGCFDLDVALKGQEKRRGGNHGNYLKFVVTCLRRLSQILKQDETTVIAQYDDILPIALHIHKTMHGNSLASWKLAVDKTSARASTRNAHPTAALRKLLVRANAWDGCTTAEVEHTNASHEHQFCKRRDHMLSEHENDETKLIMDRDEMLKNWDAIAELAQQVWLTIYGPTRRASHGERLDIGVPNKKKATTLPPAPWANVAIKQMKYMFNKVSLRNPNLKFKPRCS